MAWTQVPFVSLALGPCAGMGAGRVAASHFSVMGEGTQPGLRGRPAGGNRTRRERDQGRTRRLEDPGAERHGGQCGRHRGRRLHRSAPLPVLHATLRARTCRNAWPRQTIRTGKKRACSPSCRQMARRLTKPRKIIDATVDHGSFFEIGREWGRGIVTGLARIDGYPVGILAGDPFFLDGGVDGRCLRQGHPGTWTSAPCSTCRSSTLSIARGFAVGVKGRDRRRYPAQGVRAMTAVYQADVPVCSVVIRKAYGLAGSGNDEPVKDKVALLLAERRLGQPAHGGRYRSGVPQGTGRGRRPRTP